MKLDWARVAAWRLRRQFLDRRAPAGSLLSVAGRLCGLHAQVLSSAELTAWARVEELERGEVSRALWDDRTLVKTWAMRGTLHLLPSSELPLWHAALSTNPRYLRPVAWQNNFGMTLDDLDRLTKAIGRALHGKLMTREELVQAVGGSVAMSSWGTMFKPAAFHGLLCFAPSTGQHVRFTHPATWVKKMGPPIDPTKATAIVTHRYLAVYGPATLRELARWWGGGGITSARQWMKALGDNAVEVDVEGTRAWMLAEDAREASAMRPARSARLLPAFDQYVVGVSTHAEHFLPGIPRSRVYRPQGWLSPVLLVNGGMDGVWRHEIKGSTVEVIVEPFVTVPAWARRAAADEAERLAEFLGGNLKMRWKS